METALTEDLRIFGVAQIGYRSGEDAVDLIGTYGPYATTVGRRRTVSGRRIPITALPAAALVDLRALLSAACDERLKCRYVAFSASLTVLGRLRDMSIVSAVSSVADPVEHTRRALELLEAGAVDHGMALSHVHPRALISAAASTVLDRSAVHLARGLTGGGGVRTGTAVLEPARISASNGAVLVVQDFTPQHAPLLENLAGLVILRGGVSSHGAVVARASGLACVIGVEGRVDLNQWPDRLGLDGGWVASGDAVTVDGDTGSIFLGAAEIHQRFRVALSELMVYAQQWAALDLSVAGEDPEMLAAAVDQGVVAVDLVRTENVLARLGLDGSVLLARPELVANRLADAYGQLVRAAIPLPITIRLADFETPLAAVSALPLRGGRLGLLRPEHCQLQIEAALIAHRRSGVDGPVRMLVPFVTFAEEIHLFRRIIGQSVRRVGYHGPVLLGAMVETPSAVSRVAELATAADFLTFGLNDLTALFLGLARDASGLVQTWSQHGVVPFDFGTSPDPHVLDAVLSAVAIAKRTAPESDVIVVSDMLLDPSALALLTRAGVDRVSVGAALVPCLAVAAAQASQM